MTDLPFKPKVFISNLLAKPRRVSSRLAPRRNFLRRAKTQGSLFLRRPSRRFFAAFPRQAAVAKECNDQVHYQPKQILNFSRQPASRVLILIHSKQIYRHF